MGNQDRISAALELLDMPEVAIDISNDGFRLGPPDVPQLRACLRRCWVLLPLMDDGDRLIVIDPVDGSVINVSRELLEQHTAYRALKVRQEIAAALR